jgi:hypothetical protein
MPRPLVPPWLRRGLEAALVAAVVAIASFAGDRLGTSAGPVMLPAGPAGAVLLAPAVLAIGVITTTYPVAMAATRGDAILGVIAAWLVAVDLTILFVGGHLELERAGFQLPAGVLVGLVALAPLGAGLVGSQVGASLGFGRQAGALAAIASAVGAVVALVLVTSAAMA